MTVRGYKLKNRPVKVSLKVPRCKPRLFEVSGMVPSGNGPREDAQCGYPWSMEMAFSDVKST